MDDYAKHYQPPPINPYKILGIPENATAKEIKKAYKEKMRIFHPDKYRDKPEKISKNSRGKGPRDFRSLSPVLPLKFIYHSPLLSRRQPT